MVWLFIFDFEIGVYLSGDTVRFSASPEFLVSLDWFLGARPKSPVSLDRGLSIIYLERRRDEAFIPLSIVLDLSS